MREKDALWHLNKHSCMFQRLWTLISYFLDTLWVRMCLKASLHITYWNIDCGVFSLLDGPALSSPCYASWAASPGWAGFLTHLKGCFWHLAMLPISPTPEGSRHAGEKKQKKKAGDLAIGALPSATAALLAAEGLLVRSQCQELHPPPPPPPQLGMTRHTRKREREKVTIGSEGFCRPKRKMRLIII